jgi:hypothetical protein
MARPKRLKTPASLNLLVEKRSKQAAFRLACHQKISVGRLFEQLVEAEETRIKEGAVA